MIILGIETSCDETSAALIKTEGNKVSLISNIISSSLSLHAKTGGIIPEVAAREQVKYIIPVIKNAIESIETPEKDIDAIAVTVGPGLIGSLLVGVESARTLSYLWKKPLIPVNHLFGHIYANWISEKEEKDIKFPAIALVISGGHTDLVLIKDHKDITWLGGTRDDAAGEAFDKTGRLLNLPYPGGPFIEKEALGIEKDIYNFPRPMINSNDFDFSFSGIKTAVLREVEKIGKDNLSKTDIKNLSFSLQNAIFDVIITKTIKACNKYQVKSLVLGGGVAANNTLLERFKDKLKNDNLEIEFFVPSKSLCTDNAAMIATAGFFNNETISWDKVTANPELYFD
jgi:N6-L-threonylcarbamoyladenine synthase